MSQSNDVVGAVAAVARHVARGTSATVAAAVAAAASQVHAIAIEVTIVMRRSQLPGAAITSGMRAKRVTSVTNDADAVVAHPSRSEAPPLDPLILSMLADKYKDCTFYIFLQIFCKC